MADTMTRDKKIEALVKKMDESHVLKSIYTVPFQSPEGATATFFDIVGFPFLAAVATQNSPVDDSDDVKVEFRVSLCPKDNKGDPCVVLTSFEGTTLVDKGDWFGRTGGADITAAVAEYCIDNDCVPEGFQEGMTKDDKIEALAELFSAAARESSLIAPGAPVQKSDYNSIYGFDDTSFVVVAFNEKALYQSKARLICRDTETNRTVEFDLDFEEGLGDPDKRRDYIAGKLAQYCVEQNCVPPIFELDLS